MDLHYSLKRVLHPHFGVTMSVTQRCPACGRAANSRGAGNEVAVSCWQCSAAGSNRGEVGVSQSSTAVFDSVWLGDPSTATVSDASRPESPPVEPADLAWIRAEAERFNEYVRDEWEKLKRARQLLVEMESQAQAALHARHVELNRLEARLAVRQSDLDQRQAAQEETAGTLAAREHEAQQSTARLVARETAVAEWEARRQTLAAEVADLARLAAELRPIVEQLQFRRDELTATRADLAEQRSALDRRFVEVGRIEVALHARLQELDDAEALLRAEFDAREREWASRRAVWEDERPAHDR